MELLRLGLERGETAREALDVMTSLLEQYGQWSSGLYGKLPVDGTYDNSFMIADGSDAWMLETSGREWTAQQIKSGVYSISNEPSIRTQGDLCSTNLVSSSIEKGWAVDTAQFDYAASHQDPLRPLQASHMRRCRSMQLLEQAMQEGGVKLNHAQGVLRDHFENTFLEGPYFNAANPDFLTLCMHEHPSGFTWEPQIYSSEFANRLCCSNVNHG